ncbi:LAQU0S04e07118g1_1 [Lachancea quebecensis]|uniref:LAQU0S04e07118g1_1 n=1 Tax=Lachancea quebecensis TaxID=1654605 RepID=A0A0P1KQZ6_9SACH|nr:LAQU0S04e07118g1_1 [Lachancea quebecensis]
MSNFGRRTWDRDEFAKLERESRGKQATIAEKLSPQQLDKLKARYSNHTLLVAEATQNSNERVLGPAITSYKKGKQFGFYCELCDLTFKDTLQFVNHLNHKTHQIKFELTFGEPLILDLRDNEDVTTQEFEEVYSGLIRDFLKENRPGLRPIKKAKSEKKRPAADELSLSNGINKTMGFTGFGSTKK